MFFSQSVLVEKTDIVFLSLTSNDFIFRAQMCVCAQLNLLLSPDSNVYTLAKIDLDMHDVFNELLWCAVLL